MEGKIHPLSPLKAAALKAMENGIVRATRQQRRAIDRAWKKEQLKAIKATGGLPKLEPANKVNIYDCGTHETVTVDRYAGVTPMIIKCPDCGQPATSRWYKVNQALKPTFEWTQPTLQEMRTMPRQLIDHLTQGGLHLRKIEKHDQDAR